MIVKMYGSLANPTGYTKDMVNKEVWYIITCTLGNMIKRIIVKQSDKIDESRLKVLNM